MCLLLVYATIYVRLILKLKVWVFGKTQCDEMGITKCIKQTYSGKIVVILKRKQGLVLRRINTFA